MTEQTKDNTMSKAQKVVRASKDNSESIGVSAAVVAAWAFNTYAGVTLPVEVVAALGGLIGAVSARMKG